MMDAILELLNLKHNWAVYLLCLIVIYHTRVIYTLFSIAGKNFELLSKSIDKLDSKIDKVEASLKADIQEVKVNLKNAESTFRTEIKTVETGLRSEIKALEQNFINLNTSVIRFESNKEAELRFEKLLTNVIASKSTTQNQQL